MRCTGTKLNRTTVFLPGWRRAPAHVSCGVAPFPQDGFPHPQWRDDFTQGYVRPPATRPHQEWPCFQAGRLYFSICTVQSFAYFAAVCLLARESAIKWVFFKEQFYSNVCLRSLWFLKIKEQIHAPVNIPSYLQFLQPWNTLSPIQTRGWDPPCSV